jgi:hypothetical protein
MGYWSIPRFLIHEYWRSEWDETGQIVCLPYRGLKNQSPNIQKLGSLCFILYNNALTRDTIKWHPEPEPHSLTATFATAHL